jgi:hypothetical protein
VLRRAIPGSAHALTVTPLPSHVLRSQLMTMPNHLSERRSRYVRSAGVVGGLYLVGQYAAARVADLRDSALERRVAREKYVQAGSPLPSSLIIDTA